MKLEAYYHWMVEEALQWAWSPAFAQLAPALPQAKSGLEAVAAGLLLRESA